MMKSVLFVIHHLILSKFNTYHFDMNFIGLAAYAGESVPLRGDDFKRYVNSLRGKVCNELYL